MSNSGIVINGAGSSKGFSYQNFNPNVWAGAIVVRATNASTAGGLAATMQRVIDRSQNGNLAYSQARGSGDILNQGLANASYADCSSAVSWVIQTVVGKSPNQTYTDNGKSFASSIIATGAFMDSFNYVDGSTTPLRTGDIIIYPNGGHTAIVVDGSGRQGAPDELFALNGGYKGWLPEWGDYFGELSGSETEGEFMPRLIAPVIEPAEEYLPEDLIEAIELGALTKEELEDLYDMYYIYEGRGGYSPFEEVPLTNASYAWNRFSEVLDMHGCCPLPQGSPGSWATNSGPFTVDMAPESGSIMCFSGPDGGYGCVVELVLNEDVILTSQYENNEFTLKERAKRYGMWDFDEYMFVGFVHNPAAYMGAEDESALETFLRIAEDQVGKDQGWVVEQTGIIGPNGWSGAFVTACSKRAGSSLNIVIPNVDSVSTIGRVGVLRGMGTWKKGSIYGGGYEPSAGDIAIFRYSHTGKENMYKGDKAAIVVEADGGSFEGIMGDDGGVVTKKSYSCGTPYIAGYFCPNWESIDGTTASKKEYRNIQGLYTNGVTKYDACARTVCYMNSSYKPSIGTSKVKLAAVNYTGLLANFYSVFGQGPISTATNSELVVDYWTNTIRSYYQQYPEDFSGVCGDITNLTGLLSDGLYSSIGGTGWYGDMTGVANVSVTATVQECYEFFRSKGLNKAAAIGILANIQGESGFRTGALGDSGTSAGLMQWHNNRFSSMVNYVGANWQTNVTGQLEYAWHELNSSSYKYILDGLKSVPNTAEGARQATALWVNEYERPKDKVGAISTRSEYANGYYQQFIGDGMIKDRGGGIRKGSV